MKGRVIRLRLRNKRPQTRVGWPPGEQVGQTRATRSLSKPSWGVCQVLSGSSWLRMENSLQGNFRVTEGRRLTLQSKQVTVSWRTRSVL